jgi:hypothetical protein
MNANIKKAWVAALRSEEYDQGLNTLCEADEFGAAYCPLGVLVEVVEGEDIWVEDVEDADNFPVIRPKGQSHSSFISSEFMNKVGLEEEDAGWISELNDVLGIKFKDLAKIIEKSNL